MAVQPAAADPSAPAAAADPLAVAGVTDPPDALASAPADAEPALTSSGLPNPHGLPAIAVERPEVAVGAAFAGGLVFAMILKRLVR
jgi:hypothetical protein